MCRYRFELEDGVKVEEDAVFERSGAHVVVDDASLALLAGATVDFEDEVRESLQRIRVSMHAVHCAFDSLSYTRAAACAALCR